ncbi:MULTISPECIES: 8-oxo-dGTP diphosphatase MutT [Pseudoalteromonas]|uniref:8-oxo-dGTP diphosphatase MutT n=1 Tax=Pseudoalteromonas TaxID=53246 RepID=UPI00029B3350|nr:MULTISPECIES: 8-oxo-dGTP diphosphatase MutT [Pseudoalteromonas]AUJ68865.1 8-oxo-dGTP diphosphatase [Pseudoalteromonas sp. NC201]MBR8841958.1 8-oxo-dGTP diphosphatase MutT [Pseudoalteromonas sp. JC3]MCF2825838.1 8-oxo-dGTP diphosphatase MutT [Pseudoalteromonas sp. OF5H-5]MCF2923602.1 8-oxo-dGTP diphosphatase MutT [Pseudoalteromonas sp. DL2-H1]MCF7513892.1 8-oxo-dGTP diphosphatase MutT [Pseudoalteromonas sp. L7]
MQKKRVEVAVGVIEKNQKIFVCLRGEDQHQGGLWEFPGGKMEAGEDVFSALKRELQEEVGIEIYNSSELMRIEHDYADKAVCLYIHHVEDFSGEAHGAEGQPSQWVAVEQLHELTFPEANKAIVELLQTRKN